MNKNAIAIIFLILFSIAGLLPLIQQIFSPIKLAGLQGAFDGGDKPKFSFTGYFNGNYQKKMDFYLQYNTAFNGELVRFRNQIDYDLFGNINTMLTLGKENYIFDPNYIAARNGTNLISDSLYTALKSSYTNALNFLSKHDIPLLVIIPPNKANYYNEYLIPSTHSDEITNKKLITELINESEGHLFDADQWFLTLKDASKYPLIPKYGAHWSTYGAALAGDTVLNMIGNVLNKPCTHYTLSSLFVSEEAKFADDDYLPSLNLMRKWDSPKYVYPELEFYKGYLPKALIISDSYIWNWYDLNIIKNSFNSQSSLLYYFKTIYDIDRNNLGPLNNALTTEQLLKYEIVIILNADAGLPNFGFGFFQHIQNLNNEN